jgi:hypothetical protein
MRDRLIELLLQYKANPEKTCPRYGSDTPCEGCKHDLGEDCDYTGRFADHLLANGVIVQVQGRWVTEGKIFYCSNCRFTRNIEVYINHRYCPHCGAKMERSNENAE